MAGEQLGIREAGDAGAMRLNKSQQCATTAKRIKHILECITHSIASWLGEVILSLYLTLIRPHLGKLCKFSASQQKKDVKDLESMQSSAAELIKGLEWRG